MKVYRPVSEWVWGGGLTVPSMTVLEAESHPRFSGLLDQHGNRLMVVEERQPAGFVRFAEGRAR